MLDHQSYIETDPNREQSIKDDNKAEKHISIVSGSALIRGFASRDSLRIRSSRLHPGGYCMLAAAALASIAAIIMIIQICIKQIKRETYSNNRWLSDTSDSDSSLFLGCEAWLEDDSSSDSVFLHEAQPHDHSYSSSRPSTSTNPLKRTGDKETESAGGEQKSRIGTSPLPAPPSKRIRVDDKPPSSQADAAAAADATAAAAAAAALLEDQLSSGSVIRQMLKEPPAPSTSKGGASKETQQTVSAWELANAVNNLIHVKFAEDIAPDDVVRLSSVELQESIGGDAASEGNLVTVVTTVDPNTAAAVIPPSQQPPASTTYLSKGRGEKASTSSTPEKRRRPGRPNILSSTAPPPFRFRGAVPEMFAVRAALHPFFHLPSVNPRDCDIRFSRSLNSLRPPSGDLVCSLLSEVRSLLIKKTLQKSELFFLTNLAEGLTAHLLFYEGSPLPSDLDELVVTLGRRFLAMESLLSILDVLQERRRGNWWFALASGIPHIPKVRTDSYPSSAREAFNADLVTDMVNALATLKTGVRPSCVDVVHIKQRLFCSPYSPPYFQKPTFDPWRWDDLDFASSLSSTKPK